MGFQCSQRCPFHKNHYNQREALKLEALGKRIKKVNIHKYLCVLPSHGNLALV